jgi:hypothetical protein
VAPARAGGAPRTCSACTPRRAAPQSELNDWGKSPPDGCGLEAYEPITQWVIIMEGPEASKGMPRLYEGQVFRCGAALACAPPPPPSPASSLSGTRQPAVTAGRQAGSAARAPLTRALTAVAWAWGLWGAAAGSK